MSVYYASDLHFGVNRRKAPIPPTREQLDSGPNTLILAGDILDGGYYGFNELEKWVEPFDKVIMIPGNHEFYKHDSLDNDLSVYNEEIKKVFAANPPLDKIIYDDMVVVELDECIVIAATLWTDLSPCDWFQLKRLTHYMSDFDVITHNYRKFTTDVWSQLHLKHRQYIELMYCKYKDDTRPIVVVSHHAPSYLSVHATFKNSDINAGFVSDLDQFILDRPQIHTWIHGHTHTSHNYYIGDTNIRCNPHGYTGEAYPNTVPFDKLAKLVW